MKNRKKKGIIKFRKKVNIHAGLVIFALIFIYLTVSMITYITRDKVTIYEVVEGKNATTTNKSYKALALRDEHVVNANVSGYLNYFVREGKRVSLNSTVYSVDESGKLNAVLADASNTGDIVLTEENEKEIRNIISDYTIHQNNMKFDELYDFKATIDSKILESINLNKIKELLEKSETEGINFNINKSEKTGIAMFYTDGYEGINITNITEDNFKDEKYERKSNKSGDLIEAGKPVYKVLGSENWSLLFELSEEDIEKYKESDILSIKVLMDEREMAGSFSIVKIGDGSYGKVDFIRYMSAYASNRFLEIQIIENEETGLKIPKSAIAEEEFLLVPKSYGTKGGDSTKFGFNLKVYDDSGNETVKFITPNIAKENDEYYYVDMVDEDIIRKGDTLVMPNSTETYMVGKTEKIKGVYNVNSGYCIFKNVEIITETGDYYLVEKESAYGLKVYDHIVLDSSLVHNNKVVFTIN